MAINNTMLRQYKVGFDIWGLIVFVAVMVPAIIWAFVLYYTGCHLIYAIVNYI